MKHKSKKGLKDYAKLYQKNARETIFGKNGKGSSGYHSYRRL